MSLARLVITAVTVEGRSKSEVARDYGKGEQCWGQLLDQLRDLFLQGIDHSGELSAPVGQFSG